MDTTVESAFKVHINNHTIVKFLNVGMYCITLKLLMLINYQLTLTNFSSPLKTTNPILVDLKLKERIEITNHRGNLAGLMYKTTKISLTTIK